MTQLQEPGRQSERKWSWETPRLGEMLGLLLPVALIGGGYWLFVWRVPLSKEEMQMLAAELRVTFPAGVQTLRASIAGSDESGTHLDVRIECSPEDAETMLASWHSGWPPVEFPTTPAGGKEWWDLSQIAPGDRKYSRSTDGSDLMALLRVQERQAIVYFYRHYKTGWWYSRSDAKDIPEAVTSFMLRYQEYTFGPVFAGERESW